MRPPRPCYHSAGGLPEFIVWSEKPAGTWLQLPCSFTGELPAMGLDDLWLQTDGCYGRASWAGVEITAGVSVALTHGWQAFTRA